MINTARASAVRTSHLVLELTRMQYRDGIQHGTCREAVRLMKMPLGKIVENVSSIIEQKRVTNVGDSKELLKKIAREFDLPFLMDPVKSYSNKLPEELLYKEYCLRESNIPVKMITVMGSASIPNSESAAAAYRLGKMLAGAGVVTVCNRTVGILNPFLQGMTDARGLTVGIRTIDNVVVRRDHILDNTGLIKLPVVTTYYGAETLTTTLAAMSGRVLMVLDGLNDATSLRAAMNAAYRGTHVIFIGEGGALPKPLRHPLQERATWEEALQTIGKRIDLDGGIDDNYHYLYSVEPKMPISILASTKSEHKKGIYRCNSDFIEKTVRGLCKENYFPITGSGPGDMFSVSKFAHDEGALTMGIAFFKTYLAINPYIDIAIVGNLKLERADLMALSSVATVNMGGSHATVDEILSVMQCKKPLVNCNQSFDVAWLKKVADESGAGASILSALTPRETIAGIKKLVGSKY